MEKSSARKKIYQNEKLKEKQQWQQFLNQTSFYKREKIIIIIIIIEIRHLYIVYDEELYAKIF